MIARSLPGITSLQSIASLIPGVGRITLVREQFDRQILAGVFARRPKMKQFSDGQLIGAKQDLIERALKYKSASAKHADIDWIAECLSIIDESAFRQKSIRFYDVQFLAAISMLRGEIAEMATGEGKTFVGVIASFTQSLFGRGVHFMTTNEYLAERDREIAVAFLNPLDVSVGLLARDASNDEKHAAYRSDITYGPGYEFGFDYLRDQIQARSRANRKLGSETQQSISRHSANRNHVAEGRWIQRGHAIAIVDEADSVMIDEATTPLVLSGPSGDPIRCEGYVVADQVARALVDEVDYQENSESGSLELTAQGLHRVESALGHQTRTLFKRPWRTYVENSLHAHHQLIRDDRYVVLDDKIQLVDVNTGRILEDRTWNDGLHQAVEVKEGVPITAENGAMARISRQQYFTLYDHLSGMTGTASDAKRELYRVYGLPIRPIATHRPNQRQAYRTRAFTDLAAKENAIVEAVDEIHRTGRPILIGTRTIATSTRLADRIRQRLGDVSIEVLNGVQDEDEADIVSRAGKRDAITIATNMAGRGTDIAVAEPIQDLGGLHVFVCEIHESRRVDRQLVGRAARQGNPGSFQTFVSAEDPIFAKHARWFVKHLRRLADANGEVHQPVENELHALQKRLEREFCEQRRRRYASQRDREETMEAFAGEHKSLT